MLDCTNNKCLAVRVGAPAWRSLRIQSVMGMLVLSAAILISPPQVDAADQGNSNGNGNSGKKWVASWTTSPQNVYKGNTPLTTALANFAFPPDATDPTLRQANNQTLRMILKPDLWGDTMRVRLTNTWGAQAITFGAVTIGLQSF